MKQNRLLSCLFAIFVSAVLLFHFANFIDHAAPALVDDHDIIFALGDKTNASLREVWNDLKNTDEYQGLAQWGAYSRFRPAHYPIKSAQIYLWGDNFRLWYATTFMMYVATTAILFSLLLQSFGVTSALVFAAIYLGHRAWADIMPRLGPVEIDCIPAGVLLIWLLWRWVRDGSKASLAFAIPAALLLGALKEPNSVFMIAIGGLLLVSGLLVWNKRLMATAAVLLPIGLIVLAILLRFTSNASSQGLRLPWDPLNNYIHYLRVAPDNTRWLVAILALLLLIAAVAKYFGALKLGWGELVALAVATASIEAMRFLIYYISFSATYLGANDAIASRYGYPLTFMQSIVAAIVVGRIAQHATPRISAGIKAAAVLCILALLFMNRGMLAPQTLVSRDWWQRFNGDAEKAIDQAADLLLQARKQGKNPILLATGPALEWEPQLSLILFLHRKMPDRIVYFDAAEPSVNTAYYTGQSIKFGGTPMTPADKPALLANGCIEVHVDTDPYSSPSCELLTISLAGRP